MPRGKAEGLTLGFLGTGEMDVDEATGLIEDYINQQVKGDESVRFVFPLTNSEFSDSLSEIAKMARTNKLTYEVITSTADKSRRAFAEIASDAAKQYHVADVFTQMESILAEAPKTALLVLWDEKREAELTEICRKFLQADVSVLDLTDGLIELGDSDSEVGAEEESGGDDGEGQEGEGEEGENEAEPEHVTGEVMYSRTDLEKMSHADVKEIATGLGLAPRKAKDNMITAILERQGGFVEAPEAPEKPAAATGTAVGNGGLVEAMESLGVRFIDALESTLEEFRLQFAQTIEGVVFNTTPEEPMAVNPEPEPDKESGRRLLRRG